MHPSLFVRKLVLPCKRPAVVYKQANYAIGTNTLFFVLFKTMCGLNVIDQDIGYVTLVFLESINEICLQWKGN